MKTKFFWLALLSAMVLGGCGSAYTSISKVNANGYMVTRTDRGFFKDSGVLLYCEPAGEKLKCVEVDER